MDLSDHVVVLNFGQVIAQGKPQEVQSNPEVVRAYLGSGDVSELRERLRTGRARASGAAADNGLQPGASAGGGTPPLSEVACWTGCFSSRWGSGERRVG